MKIAITIPDVLGLDAIRAESIDSAKVKLELRLPGVRVVVDAQADELGTCHTRDGSEIEIRATAGEVSTILESGR